MPTAQNLPKPLPRAFFNRSPIAVAKDLLGKAVVRHWQGHWLAGRVVEVEAYLGEGDQAAHAFAGCTPRNAVLFGPPGRAYVYQSYGLHWCLNVSTLPAGTAGGVLFRALEPIRGVEEMLQLAPLAAGHRNTSQLLRGPGRLARAMAITRACNDTDLTRRGDLYLAEAEDDLRSIVVTPRVGITRSMDLPLRYYLQSSPAVSYPRGPVLEVIPGIGAFSRVGSKR